MKIATQIGLAALITLGSSTSILAQGCCGGMDATGMAGCPISKAANTNSAATPILSQPAKAVVDNYLKVQASLAKDSIEGIQEAANVMAKAIGDGKGMPAKTAQQAQALAAAKDIGTAREALKPLSKSLIEYLKSQKALGGSYKVAYCPMAKASWIQTDAEITNPYMGKDMLHCGQFKN